jgi:hypothetical protein
MVLVVGAGLFLDTLVTLYRLDAGIRPDGVLTMRVWTGERTPPAQRCVAVNCRGRSYKILADVEIADANVSGVIFAHGPGKHTLGVEFTREPT